MDSFRRPTVPSRQFPSLTPVHHERYLTQRPRFGHSCPPHIRPDPFVKTGACPTAEMVGEPAGAPVETPRVGPNTTLLSLGTIL